ncbi:hypothetical protein BDW22DRAFT_1335607 [Trametopsis cervina]|nr:hypothetical protein BDW22DRAFT_1335607 [Trametopsis cervina]
MLIELLINYGLAHSILSYCTPATIFKVGMTCHVLSEVVEGYVQFAFNIDRSLAVFFEDVHEFRRLQHRSGLLISGSFALQFMGRLNYEGSDLDLFLPRHSRLEVALWLQTQGYVFAPSGMQGQSAHLETALGGQEVGQHEHAYRLAGIFTVVTFRRRNVEGAPPTTIQLIIARSTPMELILGFHSTCVMNVITYDTAYSLYPRATFEDMTSLVVLDNASQKAPLAKYARRGWSLVRKPSVPDFNLDLSVRSMQDRRTWRLCLRGLTGEAPAPYIHPAEVATWKLQKTILGRMRIRPSVLSDRNRLFPIVVSDEPLLLFLRGALYGPNAHAVVQQTFWPSSQTEQSK